MCSLYKELKMEATAGLHVSQPSESGLVPTAAMTEGKSSRRLILHGWTPHTRVQSE